VGASYVPCCRAWDRGLHGCSGHSGPVTPARCTHNCQTWLERTIISKHAVSFHIKRWQV
jgi:hypothetical protein